jgi:uncharacterized protein YfaP (DUF2135 family)
MSASATTLARPVSADRRSFLAAGMATVVAVSVAAPAIAASPRAKWDAAMASYETATAAEAYYHEHVYCPEDDASVDEERPFSNAIQGRWEQLLHEASDRRMALMDTPAPDRRALRQKFDIIFTMEDGGLPAWTEEFISQTRADIARLMGDA